MIRTINQLIQKYDAASVFILAATIVVIVELSLMRILVPSSAAASVNDSGVLMEQVVMELVFNKLNYKELLCESLRTNTSVLKIHKLFGFKEISIENRVVIMKNNKNQWAEQKEELAPLMNMFRR